MKDLEDNMYHRLQYEQSYNNQEESPCNGVENVSIIVHKKKVKNRKKYQSSKYGQPPAIAFRLSRSGTLKNRKLVKKQSSMPEINDRPKLLKPLTKSSNVITRGKKHNLNTKYVVNRVSEYYFNNYVSPFNYPTRKKWKVYRCQLSTQEESCCCSCNSDAMFEVMKSLYDCYKKKNCDNCNCILCGHLPREERRMGRIRKSLADVGLAGSEKERKEKIKKAEKQLEGKSTAEKEQILKELAKSGQPLPKGKSASEKELIKKIRTELGLPPEPKTAAEKEKIRKAEAAGLITPLEGKTTAQKEKILKAQAELGIELPEGRTASERALIQKVKTAAGIPIGITSEKLRKAKEAGLLTPLEGKTAEKREKIIRGLAMQGLPLPEGKTASERKIIDKVRSDLGLPPEPKTLSMKEKYAKAANAGFMQPLEGKSNKEKEKILQGLADLGIPLPEGRSASERSLIAKVKAKAAEPLEHVAPSEKIRRAKAAGLITPIEGKPPEQQEKILRGLAMQGILLPEGKTSSEKRLIDKVRADLGLPPEPKTSSMKAKYAKAADAGLLQPLEGKTQREKEKILQGLHDLGIPLPEGRSASERSLIAKVKAKAAEPLEHVAPSEKIRRAKAAGLITPIEGKPPEQQEKILRGLAMQGILLPEGKTSSEKRLIDKVRADLGLPPEPKTSSMKAKYAKAADAGLLQPLEGKTQREKEKILQGLHDLGIPLPEGRSASERSLIAKVKAKAAEPLAYVAPSEKIRRAKAAGLITPIEGKPPEQQEKILRGLAMQGILLPEGKTSSEKRLIDKVRADLGLPPEPKTSSMKAKYAKAADAGLLQPLEGKTHGEKEKILQGLHDLGIPLPEGRSASERSLIAKVKAKAAAPLEHVAPSEKIRKAKAAGLLTPIEGKPPEQQEKILRGLAMQGILLPEGKNASEKRLIDKVRADLGLPPEPKTSAMKAKYAKAADAGLLQPLEGKTQREKEKILQGLHDLGIPLPEGRSASERSLIAKVKAKAAAPLEHVAPSEKIRKAKAAGLLTPIEGKPPEQQEKILRGLAMQGILLPEGKNASEKRLIDKVRADLGLPPEPKTSAMKARYAKAADAGLLQPLEGKTQREKEKILQGLHDLGIPLPEGRTASERSLIAKVKAGAPEPVAPAPSEKLRKAKAAGLLTPLEGKTADQKEKILRGLAMQGIPLPEGKTASEKKLIDKVRNELGLPPEPKTQSMRDRYNRAADAGFMQPLEGKSSKEKEKVLQGLYDMGIPLPEGRTKSEKALVAKIKAGPKPPTLLAPSEKLRKAKAAGLLTPLEGKPTEQKEKILRGLAMQGIPLPEAKTSSERNLTDKVRLDLGLPPEPKTPSMRERYARAADAGILKPLEGKSTKEKEKILQGLYDMGIPLPEGRTASEKSLIARIKEKAKPPSVLAPSEKMRKAKAAGLLTPLEGKTPEHREKILRGLAMQGIPLPEGKSASEKILIDKVRSDLGLPPEPQSRSMREKYSKAADAGLLQPLEGKSAREKEKILRGLHDMGIPLPEGRTKSEKSLIAKIKARPPAPAVLAPSEKLRKAKAAGLLTPLEGKTPEQREKILRGLAMQGMPLPEGKTSSEKRIIDKVRADIGLPPEPKTQSMRGKYARAADAGLMQPLEGKSHKEKEKILQGLHNLGVPLPEGRTASEKALIAKIQAESRPPSVLAPSEKLRKAKAAGLLTPLADKSPAQREKILRGLAMQGVPLPEAKTASEKMLIDKVRADLGLPPEPKTQSMRDNYNRAADAGLLQPLEGKSHKQKERILQGLHDMGIPLPEGRTASEKALVAKITAAASGAPSIVAPSEKLRKAKAAGLLTPLEGKTSAQKEKILRGLAMQGLPLPEGKTASERKLVDKVRADLGLPPEPKTPSMKEKYEKAANAGLLQPLEGKTDKEKQRILQGLHNMGIPLPEGRTASEKALIANVKAAPRLPTMLVPSEKLRKAQAAGLLTPLEGKSPAQREKILRGLAMQGIPLPEGKTSSEKMIVEKVRADLGLPPSPTTAAEKEKYNKAVAAGLITPLEGKTQAQKERILREQHNLGLPLPNGRTSSEKALIKKIQREKAEKRTIGVGAPALPPDKRRKLDEKTAKVMKEGKGPADECICGLLTPESERETPPLPAIPSEKLRAAKAAGLLTPLEGKSPEQKEKILRGLVKQGIPLPEAKTASEKKLLEKVRSELGLPPEPKTTSMKEKYAKAQAAGIMTPLEGKSASQKEKILKAQADMGVPLPEGRTASEKALIAKIKATKAPSITTEKLRKAKEAGLLTPLEGKTEEQRAKILKGLATAGMPLPEGRTASEKMLIKKIKTELGVPEPTPSEKVRKAKLAGLLTPLDDKTLSQREKILRGRAAAGLPLPVGKTASERALVQKIKKETGYVTPPPSERMRRAKAAGLLTPLEGKTTAEKEKILRDRLAAGVPIPEGKTPSEMEIIRQITAEAPPTVRPSEKMRKAQAAGVLTPLEGKSPEKKEKIIRGLIKAGVPLPEPKTASEKSLMDKIRHEVGLPPEPKTPSLKEKYRKAHEAGLITPLEGKSRADKEKVLKRLHEAGIPLPEGRTSSEKSMIKRIKAELPERKIPSEKIRAARAAGLLTPLEGKTASQKEKIIRGLAEAGIPIPEAKTASEKAITQKVRTELGLPPEPATASLKEKMRRAQAQGIITPLEGKTSAQKEQILKNLADARIPLPEGRTASEKALIAKVKAESRGRPTKITSEKMKKAKAAGLLTPLTGKTATEKERIMKGLVAQGLPLPETHTESERKIAEKIRKDIGLPPEPKSSSEKVRLHKAEAAGIVTPLEGKTHSQKERILKDMAAAGVALPEGRTKSEKSMIKRIKAEVPTSVGPPPLPPTERRKLDEKTAKVMKEGKGPSDECICGLLTPESEREEPTKAPTRIPSEKLRKAKAAGLLTPLEGKSSADKERILRGLAKEGIPLPDARTSSERKIGDKIRKELGLPPEPKTRSMKEKHQQAAAAGVLVPLEGLSPAEKERVLRAQADLGIQLPEGRTASEKALIAKIKAEKKLPPSRVASEKIRKAKAAGLLTPLEGKSGAEREKILRGLAKEGLPLPDAKTSSERKIIDKVRKEVGLPPEPKTQSMKERHEKAAAAGVLVPLEGLPPAEKEKVLRAQADLGIQLPEGRTASEKALIAKVKAESKRPPAKIASEKIRKAKEAGLLTPLEGKSAAEREKILRGLAKEGLPLPEGQTSSERKIIDKIRKELGLPPEPKTQSMKERHERAAAAGVLLPLEGLSPAEKERVLRTQADLGIQLPEGRTASEKALIAKVKAESKRPPAKIASEKIRKAKAAGLLTPLEGKSAAEKEKIIRGLAKEGLPLPEAKTSSERKITDKIRQELGLPPEPKTRSMKERQERAAAAGVLVPLEDLSTAEKEKVLRAQADLGIQLPEGRTSSEKALIAKVKAESKRPPSKMASEKIRKAKAAGLLTPLEGKSAAEKEKILRGLAKEGIPLPEAKTTSERKLENKVRKELGLPPEPKTASMKERQEKAAAAGVLVPLEGLSPAEKERVLKAQADMGLELPEGRTASERALIAKVKAESKLPPSRIASDRIRKAKTAGLLTPLLGKSASEKERILRGLAKQGLPLPTAHTSSERKIADKIRKELGLPPEPKTASMQEQHDKAAAAGALVPLEGLSPAEKERVLRAQADLGIPLPEGRTASEKALIARIKTESKLPPSKIASERIQKAKTAGLLTPLKGKKAAEKERIMRGLAKEGLPLPEAKTSSERKIADKIRKELGLPPEPKTPSIRQKYEKAAAAGILVPLDGLTPAEKERVLRGQAEMGIPLPEGRTSSEKSLIAKIKAEIEPSLIPSAKLKKAKAAGLLTPLEGKSHAQKEKIIKSLAEAGLPLPEGKTASEKALIHKMRTELGIPPPARTASEKAVVRKAKAEGLLTPIAGKSAKEKERIIKGLAEAGLPIPEGKTASEKELIKKIRTTAGLPPEPTPSEKRGEIKTKSKRVGVTASKKLKAKGIGVGGMTEEYEDILKSTTCDRGCGCDKKKIRFKHSYVKIRVTSPDISSLCPCPDECIPGVKAGAFIDNEGIKVTVGRVDGVTSYTSQYSNHILESSKHIITIYDKILSNRRSINSSSDIVDALLNNNTVPNNLQQTTDDAVPSQRCVDNNSTMNHGQLYSSSSYSSISYDSYKPYIKDSHRIEESNSNDRWIDGSGRFLDATGYLETLGEIYRRPVLMSFSSDDTTELSSLGSFESILVIKSESSLSLTSTSSVDVISVISFSNSSSGSNSTHYLYYPVSGGNFSDSTVEELECLTNKVDYIAADTVTSQSNSLEFKARQDETHTNVNGNSKETASAIRRKHNEYLTFRMSQMKFSHEIPMTKMSTRKTNTGEPVIVINNLNSEHDITTMVDQLLSKNEFSDASSIFVVVPTSDNDSDHSINSVNSTICIQVSEQLNNWHRNKSDVEERQITPSHMVSASRGLRISRHGRKYFIEGIHDTVTIVHNKETLVDCPKGYVYTGQRSKFSELSTGRLLSNRYNVASTDTTADRPCCCAPKIKKDAVQNLNSNHRCVANVVSELITPLLVNQGLGRDPYHGITTLSLNQQPSFISMNRPPTPVGACRVPPCAGRTGCHQSSDMYQIPVKPPVPPPQPENQSKPCQCSPEKLKEMLEQAVKAGKAINTKSTACGGAAPKPSPVSLTPPVPKPTDPENDCAACSKHKYKDGVTMQCVCNGKKKTVKLNPLCPCEQHQPPISNTATGPKTGTRSLGCQCCICAEGPETCAKKFFGLLNKKPTPKVGYLEVLGPAGGLAQMEKEGTYTQAGRRDLPTRRDTTAESSTNTKKNCVCKDKRGKKKKNVICECPPAPIEPEPEILEMTMASPLDFSYEELKRYQLYEQKLAMKQKSDMTQTLSGFKMLKKKKPPTFPEPEFTVEDAVRYYATLHPDLLKDLCPPPPDFREEDCSCEDDKPAKKTKHEVDCSCPYEPPPPPPPPPPTTAEPVKEDEGPFRGLKFRMGGKGSGSRGLGGVCCFDMVEELNISRQRSDER